MDAKRSRQPESGVEGALLSLSSAAEAVQRAVEDEKQQAMVAVAAREEELKAARELLEQEKSKFLLEQANFEEERDRIITHASLGEMVRLNIGGESFVETRRSTLCQCEDSMLYSLFSGRWEEQVTRDSDGRIFLDFSPEVFMPLLRFLREVQLAGPDDRMTYPTVPDCAVGEFKKMIRFFGLWFR